MSRQLVESHDPNKKAASGPASKWRALIEETRKTFLEDTATIAISHRAVRLWALQRMANELGDSYTNRRAITGPDGGPVEVRNGLS